MESSALVINQPHLDVVIHDAVIHQIPQKTHPIKAWLAEHPGTGNYEIAENISSMSRCEVYNWLLNAVKSGEVEYDLGKYYLAD